MKLGVSKYRNDCASQSSLSMRVLGIVAGAQNIHSSDAGAMNRSVVALDVGLAVAPSVNAAP